MSIDQTILFFHKYLQSPFVPKLDPNKIVHELSVDLSYPSIQYCKENGIPLDVERVWTNMIRCCQYLKQNNVIHLNINPRNVLVNPQNNSIKLFDFSHSELTKFHNTEIEGGLQKIENSGLHDVGCVLQNGWFSKYIPINSKLQQHNFIHLKRGTTRCKFYPNDYPYLDPIIECAKRFEIEEYITIDDRIDIFSCAMIILYLLIDDGDLFCIKHNNSSNDLLNFIKSVRGPSNPRDVWLFGNMLKQASKIKGHDLTKNDKYLGIWMAIKDIMTGGDIISHFEKQ